MDELIGHEAGRKAFMFMDAVHYKAREEGRIITKAAYVVLWGSAWRGKGDSGNLDRRERKPEVLAINTQYTAR